LAGVSIQLYDDKECSFIEFIDAYLPMLEAVIINFGEEEIWVVNHDDKNMPWFPTDNGNLSKLRLLFKQYNISNTFRGYLTLTGKDLILYSQDFISYPFRMFAEEGMLYKNIDISHSSLPFIIKISGHLTVDFISTDKRLLKKLIGEYTKKFIVKEYWGSNIWD